MNFRELHAYSIANQIIDQDTSSSLLSDWFEKQQFSNIKFGTSTERIFHDKSIAHQRTENFTS